MIDGLPDIRSSPSAVSGQRSRRVSRVPPSVSPSLCVYDEPCRQLRESLDTGLAYPRRKVRLTALLRADRAFSGLAVSSARETPHIFTRPSLLTAASQLGPSPERVKTASPAGTKSGRGKLAPIGVLC